MTELQEKAKKLNISLYEPHYLCNIGSFVNLQQLVDFASKQGLSFDKLLIGFGRNRSYRDTNLYKEVEKREKLLIREIEQAEIRQKEILKYEQDLFLRLKEKFEVS